MLKAFEGRAVQVSSEPRLREQDFGNFQDPTSMEAVMAERSAFERKRASNPRALLLLSH